MAKRKFTRRIRDAWKAYKDGPVIFEAPVPAITVSRPQIRIARAAEYIPGYAICPETCAHTERVVAANLGRTLLDAGVIKCVRTLERGDGIDQLRISAEIQVIVPEKTQEEAEP